MDLTIKFSEKFDKLIRCNPVLNFESTGNVSSLLLFRDYFTRLQIFKNEIGAPDFSRSSREFHDLIAMIDPEGYKYLPSLEKFYSLISSKGFDRYHFMGRTFNGLFIYLSICWELTQTNDRLPNSPISENPYRPVMEIIERNQRIHWSEGHFYIGTVIYLNRGNKFLLPSIAKDFLKLIDESYTIKPFHPIEVPDQEAVNNLWAYYKQNNRAN